MLHKGMMRSFQPCPLNKYSLLKGSEIDNHIYAMEKQCYLMLSGSNSKPFLVTSDLKRSSGLQLNKQYPHCTEWEYTYDKHRYTKAPLALSSSHSPPPQKGRQPQPMWKMWPLLKCFQGYQQRRQQSVKVRVTEHRITHRWFSAAPPLGSALPLERGPRCSSSPSRNSAGSWGRSAGSPSISSRCWKWFLPGWETETRREALEKEEWADTWRPQRSTKLCWGALLIPLFHSPHLHYQCWTRAHVHLPYPLLTLWDIGRLPLPENSSPWSIKASFTASYPCNTTVGLKPKYTVNTGP